MDKASLEQRLEHLLEVLFAGLRASTKKAKRADLTSFAAWLDAGGLVEMAQRLFAGGQGGANDLVLQYRQALLEAGRTASTINRQLSSIRSLVKLGRMLGYVPWTLEVANIKGKGLRDTRGPGKTGVEMMLAELERRGGDLAVRDAAIVHLLFDLGLRRKEVVGLDLEDLVVSPERSTLAILGKGRRQKEKVTAPAPAVQALRAWVAIRGDAPGPMFHRLDRAREGASRLTATGLYKMISKLGKDAGLKVSPHGLRHAAVTEALKRTGGDVRAAQRFARHADPRTTMVYDDDLQDIAGQTAEMVAERPETDE